MSAGRASAIALVYKVCDLRDLKGVELMRRYRRSRDGSCQGEVSTQPHARAVSPKSDK